MSTPTLRQSPSIETQSIALVCRANNRDLTGYVGRRFPIPVPHLIKIWRLLHSADVIHVMDYWYLLAAFICLISHSIGRPIALCPAGEFVPEFRNKPWKKFYFWLFGRKMIANAASIIATTSRERDDILQTERVAAARMMIFPNTISPITITGKSTVTLPIQPFILFLGRLTFIKGPDLLVDAFAKISGCIPNVRLIIAGLDCGMRAAVESKVRSLGLSGRATFLGFVDDETRQHLYRAAALLVVPLRSEVMSVVVLETAAMGTPVLLTDRCGFDEVGKVGGGLVVPADVDGLAKGLTRMFDETDNFQLMGERLRNFVLAQYAWTNVTPQLQSHLARLAFS